MEGLLTKPERNIQDNDVSISKKKILLEQWIPLLTKVEKTELFDVIKSYNIPYTKNRNGIFFNIACLDDDVVDRLYLFCKFYRQNAKISKEVQSVTASSDDGEKDTTKTEKPNILNAIDKSIMQECVRDVIKNSISKDLQEKLNMKLSTLQKESNWKHTPLPSNHTKNAELGKVRGRIIKRKNTILKRCRDISLYLSKNSSTKDVDTLSATNELETE